MQHILFYESMRQHC